MDPDADAPRRAVRFPEPGIIALERREKGISRFAVLSRENGKGREGGFMGNKYAHTRSLSNADSAPVINLPIPFRSLALIQPAARTKSLCLPTRHGMGRLAACCA